MFKDDCFKFNVSVSTDSYWNKEDVNACIGSSKNETNKLIRQKYGRSSKAKISFREVEVTVLELLDYCIKGHSFCNLFRGYPDSGLNDKGKTVTYKKKDGSFTMSAKCDKFFYGSNVICVDIEETCYSSIQDYVGSISIMPTLWYSTFSHMQPGKGVRFRMVYVLDQTIVGKEQFETIVDAFNRRIEMEVNEAMHDKCNKKPAQYFNGTNVANGELCIEYGGSGYIYSINELINVNNIIIEKEDNNKTTTCYPTLDNKDSREIITPSKKLLYNMQVMDYDAFMTYHRHLYTYTYRSDIGEWINDTYQFVTDDYFKLYWNANILLDGHKRRKKIFQRMCLRRLMNPGIDIDTVVFCAYEDIHRFCDNSDGAFDVDYLERNAIEAFTLTLDEIKEKYSENIAYLRNKRPKSGIILKSDVAYAGAANAVIKGIKYEIIDQYYNPDFSVKENLQQLSQVVAFPISRSALYEYCHDRGIALGTLSDDDILANLDVSMSIRENLKLLADLGMKVGKDRISRLLNLARAQQAQQPLITHEQPLSASDLGITVTDTTANGWSGWSWSSYTSPFGF
jgi:hypothetical protein